MNIRRAATAGCSSRRRPRSGNTSDEESSVRDSSGRPKLCLRKHRTAGRPRRHVVAGRLNVIQGLQADLAAAIYRVRGDIRPLQEVTLGFMQRTTNAAYDEAVELYDIGKLTFRLSPQETVGDYVDALVRDRLRSFFNGLRIPIGPGSAVRVNSRVYDSSTTPRSYRRDPPNVTGEPAFGCPAYSWRAAQAWVLYRPSDRFQIHGLGP